MPKLAIFMAVILWLLIIILGILILWFILSYNSFIKLRNQIDNAWSQIDVQLKRRFDLIPNLMNTIKGYMKHEKSTLTELTEARTAFLKSTDVKGKAKAEGILEGALKTIFAVAENYPNLKASENFMQLQEELSGTESKIAYSRQHYNDSVQSYENKRESFPSNIIANIFNFGEKQFFKVEEKERENVKVEF